VADGGLLTVLRQVLLLANRCAVGLHSSGEAAGQGREAMPLTAEAAAGTCKSIPGCAGQMQQLFMMLLLLLP
jgi:hypothetical protein